MNNHRDVDGINGITSIPHLIPCGCSIARRLDPRREGASSKNGATGAKWTRLARRSYTASRQMSYESRRMRTGRMLPLGIVVSLLGCASTPSGPSSTTTTSTAATTTTSSVPPTTTTSTSSVASTSSVSSTTSVASTTTTTTAPDLSEFFGVYDVTFVVTLDTGCNIKFSASGTVTLSGDPDGSPLEIDVFERAERNYRGRLRSSGSFSGSASGFTPGLLPLHDFTGQIEGDVHGSSIAGEETLDFGAGCPGEQVVLEFSGTLQ